jgi:aspartate aminotransferase
MQVSERVKGIAASQSLAMAARAKAMKAAGIDVISMSLGEPDMDTPEHIRRAAQEATDNGWTHYGPVAGIASLRTAVAAAQNANCRLQIDDCKFDASDVIVSVGAKMAIYNAIQTVINPGDEVVIPMPSWVSYTEMVKLAGGKVVPVQTQYENRYCLTADELRGALTEKTRMLILCSPNNPTGSIYSYEELKALVAVLWEYPEVTVLSDEIYDALIYEGTACSMAAFEELKERLIIVNGVSKAYAMTGWRIGWLMSKNKAFIEACTRLQGQQVTCATMVAQKAAEAALTGSQDCVEAMRQVFAERRELICRLAAEIPGWKFEKPQGAFYLFPDVSALGSGDKIAEYLLEEAHVAVVSGSAFGCPDCIRLSYAISTEEIIEVMRRIKVAIEKLK